MMYNAKVNNESAILSIDECASLVERASIKLLNAKFGILKQDMSAEDVTNELLIKFMSNGFIEKYDASRKVSKSAYVYRGVWNALADMCRTNHFANRYSLDYEVTDGETAGMFLEDAMDIEEQAIGNETLAEMLDMCNGNEKTKIVSADGMKMTDKVVASLLYAGYSVQEIARKFGCHENTVHKSIYRLRQQLSPFNN